ncbi:MULTISPECIES: hypothetical protein [unclassified Rhizobium]|uniref:hypothetical protein n=1 Tax=unclassified Rhizobium TaxID=2613769 RepID=UPI000EAA68D7|nr:MULTISPECIES: hypothetical protein [unclassified Rhizobium]
MEIPDESDLLRLLKRVLRDTTYEISDFEALDRAAIGLLAQALDLRLIRDDSTGWDTGARYVLTDDGRRALGLQVDWWMPEDLRQEISSEPGAASNLQDRRAPCRSPATITTKCLWGIRTPRAVYEPTPTICFIAVICGIILMTMVGGRLVSH